MTPKQSFREYFDGLTGEDGPDNSYNVKDAAGISYDSRLGAVCEWLGFCGCGNPEMALSLVVDALRTLTNTRYPRGVLPLSPEADAWRERWRSEWAKIGDERVQYFVWYMLAEWKLTEHGGSVPGWLTYDGEYFLTVVAPLLTPAPEPTR